MENRKINDDSNDSARSSSPAIQERRSKHRKLDQSIFSSLNNPGDQSVLGTEWRLSVMKKEVSTLRAKLSQTEDIAAQHYNLRKRSEKLFEKEKNVLKTQMQVYIETIEKLREDVETSMRSMHEARKAQAAAETALSQMKTKMQRQIRELVNAGLETQEVFKLEPIDLEQPTCEIERSVERNSQKNSDILQWESQEQKTTAVVKEEQPKSPGIQFMKSPFDKCDVSVAKTSHEKVLSPDQINSEDSSSGVTDEDDSSSDSLSADDLLSDSSSEASEQNSMKTEQRKARELRVGYNRILVSSRKFFELDWEGREYFKEKPGEWSCRKCLQVFNVKHRIEDHVWTKHYGGTFDCPFCIAYPTRRTGRYLVTSHIKMKHPNGY